MADISDLEAKLPPSAQNLLKFNEHILGITLVCYVMGFVITNLYLGSLGIVSLDVIRVKYVLTGILFMVFLGTVAFLLYGVQNVLGRHPDTLNAELIVDVIGYSLTRLGVIAAIVLALTSLAGTISRPPIGIPQVSPALEWSKWLQDAPPKVLMVTTMGGITLLFIVALLILLLSVILFAINPRRKDGTKPPRREQLRHAREHMRQAIDWILKPRNVGRVLVYVLAFFLLFLAYNAANSLLAFIGTNKVGLEAISNTGLQYGWDRFVGAAFMLYALATIILLGIKLLLPFRRSKKSEKESTETEDDPTDKYSGLIWLFAMIISVIVPVYALGVYPALPQQIGGGSVVPVGVLTSSDELEQSFSDPAIDVYLLDRSSNRSLFLLVNKQQQTQLIMEVANSQVQSITYKPFP